MERRMKDVIVKTYTQDGVLMSYVDVSPKVAPCLGIHDVAVVFVEEPTCSHALLLHGGRPWGEG